MSKPDENQQQACAQLQYEITAADLPLSCPTPHQLVWNAHPRVYLPLMEAGEVVCPYCGTKYILKDFTA